MTDPSYGFLGQAESAPANVQLQLDNFVPDDVDVLLVPAGGGGPAIPMIRQWITDSFGPDSYEESTDVVDELMVRQADTGVSSVLVVSIDQDEISDKDRAMIARALDVGIRVRSLNHMMDDITEHDILEDSGQAPASPEPVAEAPPASKRARRTPTTAKPAESLSEPQESKPRGRPRRTAAAPAEEEKPAPALDPAATVPGDTEAFWAGTSKELLALIDARVEVVLRTRTMLTVDVIPF